MAVFYALRPPQREVVRVETIREVVVREVLVPAPPSLWARFVAWLRQVFA